MPTVSDERKLVVEQCLGKMSIEEIRKHTGPDGVFPRVAAPMASSTVRALKRRIEEHGDVLHRKQRVDKATLSVAERQHISATFAGPAARAKTTTAQLGQQLLAEGFSYHGRSATGTFPPSTLNDAARSMNLSYKQLTPQPLGVNGWQRVLQHQLADQYPARCIVAFDESHVGSNAADALRGRAPRGEAAIGWQVPSTWSSVLRTVFGVITLRGFDMSCCEVLTGSIDDDRFYYDFFLPKLLPNLNPHDDRLLENSVIMFDNAGQHWQPRVIEAILDAGVVIIPLTPRDFGSSPPESAFNQMKAYVRREGHRPLFRGDATFCLLTAMESVTPKQARGYFRNCGYTVGVAAEEGAAEEDTVEAICDAVEVVGRMADWLGEQ